VFVVVLIDGDGAKFTEELLQSQDKGGAEAAFRLNKAVREYVAATDPELCEDDTPVVVKIWANLGGLTNALHKDGSVKTRFQMSEFAEHFSRSRAEFDFINVGRGKENADMKMRRMFSFYHNNVQCRKIIFAGCHDAGYNLSMICKRRKVWKRQTSGSSCLRPRQQSRNSDSSAFPSSASTLCSAVHH